LAQNTGMAKTKMPIWLVAAVLAVAVVAVAVWWRKQPPTVTLNNGAKLKLVGVTYGKHHSFPGFKAPPQGQGSIFDSTNNTLFVWLEQQHPRNKWPRYQLLACDPAATACVGNSMMISHPLRPGEEMVALRLDAFPRRAAKIHLRFLESNPQTGRPTVEEGFIVANPARGPFPAWSPNPLPNTRADGDLSVTLTRLVSGVQAPDLPGGGAPSDPATQGVLAAFRIQQGGRAITNWLPVRVETSDATGNHSAGWCNTHWENGEALAYYQWGLWPDEPAWKLRVELSRTSGFADSELWTVENLPLQAGRMQDFGNYGRNRGDAAFAETTLKGVHLKLFPARQFTDTPPGAEPAGGFVIQTDRPLDGMRMTLIRVTDERGRPLQIRTLGRSDTDYRFGLRELGNVRSLKLTLALHPSRFVEFTAKPARP
jgi:hypothetical protein